MVFASVNGLDGAVHRFDNYRDTPLASYNVDCEL